MTNAEVVELMALRERHNNRWIYTYDLQSGRVIQLYTNWDDCPNCGKRIRELMAKFRAWNELTPLGGEAQGG